MSKLSMSPGKKIDGDELLIGRKVNCENAFRTMTEIALDPSTPC